MQAIGVLLLAAATAGDGFGYANPGVGLKKWLRPHAVMNAPAPGPPMYTAASVGGAGGPMGAAPGRRFVTTRSQIYFLDPDGMQIGWQATAGPNGERAYMPSQLTVPARYNFGQGYIYRLKLTNIPGRPGAALYPTIEVAPTTPATDAYLSHNAIPVQFTDEDFRQVLDGGNFVTKVIYLPDPRFQELAVSGVETLVSTRLEPGIDPIIEADKRGTILLIVRVGAIDLEMPNGGGMAPGAAGMVPGPVLNNGTVVTTPAAEMPPGSLPPGMPATNGTVILDPQPAGAAPAVGTPPGSGVVMPPAGQPATPAPVVPPAVTPEPNPAPAGPSANVGPNPPAIAATPADAEVPDILAPAAEPPADEAPPPVPKP